MSSDVQTVSGIPRLRRPTPSTNPFGTTPSSLNAESGPSRRSSVSPSNAREIELTSEVSTLKTQIGGLKIRLDKAENLRLAAEKAGKKKEEELIDRLEEAKDELDFYKQNAERSGVDPKKVKELEGKVIDLDRKCEGLVKEVNESKVEKNRLEGEIKKVQELEEELPNLWMPIRVPLCEPKSSRSGLESPSKSRPLQPHRHPVPPLRNPTASLTLPSRTANSSGTSTWQNTLYLPPKRSAMSLSWRLKS